MCARVTSKHHMDPTHSYLHMHAAKPIISPSPVLVFFLRPHILKAHRDTVVLGGTGQVGSYSLEVSEADRRNILEGCKRLLPSLEHAEVRNGAAVGGGCAVSGPAGARLAVGAEKLLTRPSGAS